MRILEKIRSLWPPRADGGHSRERLMNAFQDKYVNFQSLLRSNTELLAIIADIEHKLEGRTVFGPSYIDALSMRCIFHTARMVRNLEHMAGKPFPVLRDRLAEIFGRIKPDSVERMVMPPERQPLVLPYGDIRRDQAALVGVKNANIAEILNTLDLPTPRGFAITTEAFRRFFRVNDLSATIVRMKRKADLIETETILEVSAEIQAKIKAAKVPDDLAQSIMQEYDRLVRDIGEEGSVVHMSMRSSALGEDSTLSFAGQYLTVLNVPRERILSEYRQIIASLFAPHAIAYRLHMAITFEDAVMAVACQEMIDAVASGVMFTRNPLNPLENRIFIDAVWGLGPYAVDGVVTPDVYILSKDPAPRLVSVALAPKSKQLVAEPGGRVREAQVPLTWRTRSCLTDDQARQLAVIGMRLEAHYNGPQDIEWALDRRGRLVVLQTRPLRVHAADSAIRRRNIEPVAGHPLLLEGGEVACTGIGCGPVFLARRQEDLATVPDGAVLVCANASSQLVMAMPKVRAILADTGNVAGHLALLTREYMIPAIVNLKNATSKLTPGTEVTVDAFNGRVYGGRVPDLINAGYTTAGIMVGTDAYQELRRRADTIVPLNLKDPRAPGFDPAHCRTVHDIMRFIHEKAYEEIFQLGDLVTDQSQLSVRLDAPLPLDLYIIDLGGGLSEAATGRPRVYPGMVASVPFSALLKGMLHDDLQSRQPRPIHLGGFLSVVVRQMTTPPNPASERFGDRSYAIISDRYMNFSSRVGYHYSVLDSYCGRTAAKNYINFQFKGGAADDVRRGRRARVIEIVLSASGFLVSTVVDRVTARVAKQEAGVLAEKLDMLGRLLIFTRQMDMLMHSDQLVAVMARAFLNGNYHLQPDGHACNDAE